jgi:hypothetical protein
MIEEVANANLFQSFVLIVENLEQFLLNQKEINQCFAAIVLAQVAKDRLGQETGESRRILIRCGKRVEDTLHSLVFLWEKQKNALLCEFHHMVEKPREGVWLRY